MTESADFPLLQLCDASVRRGDNLALNRISLTIRAGESTAILGPNGSGKSTLVQLLTGHLYPLSRPDGAESVRVFGRSRWNLVDLRSRIGVVSGDLHQRYVAGSSLGFSTILQSVIASFFGSEVVFAHHEVEDRVVRKALAAIDRAGIPELAGTRMDRVSTGQARRALIARALVNDPEVLVLDEPTTGLDPVAREELILTLRQVAQQGTTLLLVTHHFEEIVPEIERVVLLDRGQIVADGPVATTLTAENVSMAFQRPIEVHHDGDRYRVSLSIPATERRPAGDPRN